MLEQTDQHAITQERFDTDLPHLHYLINAALVVLLWHRFRCISYVP